MSGTDGGGGPTDAGGGTCEPTGGSAVVPFNCDSAHVAILAEPGAATRVHLTARMFGPVEGACMRVESVDIVESGRTLQTITTGTRTVLSSSTSVLAIADAVAEVTTPCSGDTGRFDALGLRVRGTTDGGTFEALCGSVKSGSRWPPGLVRSCHSGIEEPPFGSNAHVMNFGPSTSTELWSAFRHPTGTMILTAGPDVRLIPQAYTGFGGGPPLMPRDTRGWEGHTSEMGDGRGGTFSQAQLFASDDPLMTELCPVATMIGPGFMPPPVFLGRISGTTTRGPFSSEVYFTMCTRPPTGP